MGHEVARHDGQLLQDVDEQLHRAASPPLVEPLVLGETCIEGSEEWEWAEAGEGVVPRVPAHLDDPGGESGLGAGQLDGGQLPVHLQIQSQQGPHRTRVLSERQKNSESILDSKKEVLPYIVLVFLFIFKVQFFQKK